MEHSVLIRYIQWLAIFITTINVPIINGHSDLISSTPLTFHNHNSKSAETIMPEDNTIITPRDDLQESTTIWPKMETISWPEETNMQYISKNPDAVYNRKVRDEMERRVTEIQKKINEGRSILSDDERKKLGMKILKNYQTQRQMREMQQALDRGVLQDREKKETKEKLVKMVIEIEKEWLNKPAADAWNRLETAVPSESSRQGRSKRSVLTKNQVSTIDSFDSIHINRHSTAAAPQQSLTTSTAERFISSKYTLLQQPFRTPNLPSSTIKSSSLREGEVNSYFVPSYNNQREATPIMTHDDDQQIDVRMEEMMKHVTDNVAKAVKEKAEQNLMDALRRAGLNGITKVGGGVGSSGAITKRKRREIMTKNVDKPIVQTKLYSTPSQTRDELDEILVAMSSLTDSIVTLLDDTPLTKTVYEFFVGDGFKLSMIKQFANSTQQRAQQNLGYRQPQ